MCPKGERKTTQKKRKKKVPWVLQKGSHWLLGETAVAMVLIIVTSSLMSDHQNYVRLCSLLNMAKLACLADLAGGQFCTCLSCHRGQNFGALL
jgi:hypothetical protein